MLQKEKIGGMEIDVKQKDAIDKGLKQLDNGLGVPHEEVMRNIFQMAKK